MIFEDNTAQGERCYRKKQHTHVVVSECRAFAEKFPENRLSPLNIEVSKVAKRNMHTCASLSEALCLNILVPRGRAPFGQHKESRPLARSNVIPVLNDFANTID